MTVTVEINGKTYPGEYTVEHGMLIVQSAFGRRAAQLGSAPAELLARIMLRESIIPERDAG